MDALVPNSTTTFPDIDRVKMTAVRKEENSIQQNGQEVEHKTRAGRTLRNRSYRRVLEDQKLSKRLFTPEIKRFLKSWLVRRRKNPYPNRSEKKDLALKTGLTYIQICNWFANWRRKLKKSSKEKYKSTWGCLIKDYNTKAQGNVEQFSISSDDSIWDETAYTPIDQAKVKLQQLNYNTSATGFDHCYYSMSNGFDKSEDKLYYEDETEYHSDKNKPKVMPDSATNMSHLRTWGGFDLKTSSNKKYYYKKSNKRAYESEDNIIAQPPLKKQSTEPPLLLSKWLESAARFVPRDSFISWSTQNCSSKHSSSKGRQRNNLLKAKHCEEELDAAEALTSLSSQHLTNSKKY